MQENLTTLLLLDTKTPDGSNCANYYSDANSYLKGMLMSNLKINAKRFYFKDIRMYFVFEHVTNSDSFKEEN